MTPERLAQLKHTIQMALLDWKLAHDDDEPCDLLDSNWELVQAVEDAQERERLQNECVVCHAALEPRRITPHCEDCIVTEEADRG